MEWPSHGGQPQYIKKLFDFPQQKEMLDFSANLNPLGPPQWIAEEIQRQLPSIEQYPDPSYTESKEAIAHCEGISPEQVLVTNGGAEAIFLIAKHFEGKRALILQPTFSEYEQACRHYHIAVMNEFMHLEASREPGYELTVSIPIERIIDQLQITDVIFICRPNNPTGTMITQEQLHPILQASIETNTTIVIDEAFADFLPQAQQTLTSWLSSFPNLILLRSMTKLYTIPGLRLGYILAPSDLIKKLKGYQIPWSVNSVAASLIPALLSDKMYLQETYQWLEEQLSSLFFHFNQMGYFYSPTKVNFYLLQDRQGKQSDRQERMYQWYQFLLANGLLARHTHNFKGLQGEYLRFAVRSKEENERLIQLLQKWREIS